MTVSQATRFGSWGFCGELSEKRSLFDDFADDPLLASLRWETGQEGWHEGDSCGDHSGVRGFDSDFGGFSGAGAASGGITAWRHALHNGASGRGTSGPDE